MWTCTHNRAYPDTKSLFLGPTSADGVYPAVSSRMKTRPPRATAQSLCLFSTRGKKVIRRRREDTEIPGSFRKSLEATPNQNTTPPKSLGRAGTHISCYDPSSLLKLHFSKKKGKLRAFLLGVRVRWVPELGDVKQKKPDAEHVYFVLPLRVHAGGFSGERCSLGAK